MFRVNALFFVVSLFFLSLVTAEVRLPNVLGNHMVLQREKPINVWGWAEAGEEISVAFAGKTMTTKTGQDGKWLVTFPAQKANAKGQEMKISGANTIILKDLLIGDVWLGSGQSNMEWQLGKSKNGKTAIPAATNSKIRLFHVPKVKNKKAAEDVNTKWKVCSPQTVTRFSGVLYFFGLKLQSELNVPIGLINSSWGGSPIEPWFAENGGMYNGMIAPLHNFALKGFTWYQGETNVIRKNGLKYHDHKKKLIEGWRQKWNDQSLSFYYVQIAPWSGGRYAAGQLPALWEAQTKSLSLPKTGMVVTTDLVDKISDIHPRNKLDVGNRLARWALAKDYGKDIVYSGPIYKSMKIEGRNIHLSFAHTVGGLKSRDGKELSEFQIAGDDNKFVPAKAIIDGETVVVSAAGVSAPKNVRFGWHKTANPNLVNKDKLPASPFQTDKWQGSTGE